MKVKIIFLLVIIFLVGVIVYQKKNDTATEETSLSERDSVLFEFLVMEGFKFQKAWEKILHPDMDKTLQLKSEQMDWDEIDLIADQAPGRASLSFLRAALMLDSTAAGVYHLISYPLASLDSIEAAIAACEKSIELFGDTQTFVPAWLGTLYFKNDQRDKAIDSFKKQILMDPSKEYWYKLVKSYVNKCDLTPEEREEILSLSELHKGK